MTEEVEKQLRQVLRKQRRLAMLTVNPIERAQICGAWFGFLAGMRLSGVITNKEYHHFYDEMTEIENKKLA